MALFEIKYGIIYWNGQKGKPFNMKLHACIWEPSNICRAKKKKTNGRFRKFLNWSLACLVIFIAKPMPLIVRENDW